MHLYADAGLFAFEGGVLSFVITILMFVQAVFAKASAGAAPSSRAFRFLVLVIHHAAQSDSRQEQQGPFRTRRQFVLFPLRPLTGLSHSLDLASTCLAVPDSILKFCAELLPNPDLFFDGFASTLRLHFLRLTIKLLLIQRTFTLSLFFYATELCVVAIPIKKEAKHAKDE
ncbi:MAG: hypothetical protein IJJ26_08930 [Victivallales bacterium]|nr:hypothetical protein [Victivallales bacterium]